MRNTMRTWMLGTALVAGLIGTGAVAANAAPQEFRGGRAEQRNDRCNERGEFRRPQRGPEGGFQRGYERRDGGYYGGGYGFVGGGPVYGGYVAPYPGDGYIWLNGAWVFRGRPEVAYGYGYRGDGRFDRGFGRGGERGFDRGRGFEGGRGFDRGERGRR